MIRHIYKSFPYSISAVFLKFLGKTVDNFEKRHFLKYLVEVIFYLKKGSDDIFRSVFLAKKINKYKQITALEY